jgi:hypothetical protein
LYVFCQLNRSDFWKPSSIVSLLKLFDVNSLNNRIADLISQVQILTTENAALKSQ